MIENRFERGDIMKTKGRTSGLESLRLEPVATLIETGKAKEFSQRALPISDSLRQHGVVALVVQALGEDGFVRPHIHDNGIEVYFRLSESLTINGITHRGRQTQGDLSTIEVLAIVKRKKEGAKARRSKLSRRLMGMLRSNQKHALSPEVLLKKYDDYEYFLAVKTDEGVEWKSGIIIEQEVEHQINAKEDEVWISAKMRSDGSSENLHIEWKEPVKPV